MTTSALQASTNQPGSLRAQQEDIYYKKFIKFIKQQSSSLAHDTIILPTSTITTPHGILPRTAKRISATNSCSRRATVRGPRGLRGYPSR